MLQHGLQRFAVGVQVGQQGDAHRRVSTSGGAALAV
jgi:hypothetical protein